MDLAVVFLTLGALFVLGLVADLVGRHSSVPRVTLLLLGGVAVGQSGLGLVPDSAYEWYEFLSVSALTMVAFLLGGSLSRKSLARHGVLIFTVSVGVVLCTLAIVALGLMALGAEPGLALILGAIATATAPAATVDVIRQMGVKNEFTETVEGVVAIDDAWGLLVFAFALTGAHMLNGAEGNGAIMEAFREIGGAVLLGLVVGIPGSYLTGRITEGEPLQTEALALVFLIAGLSTWFGISFLLAGIVAGAVVVNLARHHERSFHEIEHVQWPFMLLFFVLAGSSLEVHQVIAAGVIGVGFVVLRVVSRLIGGWIGAALGGAPASERRLYGPALLPQAGVAVGMALVASRELPDVADVILAVTIASTVVFEIVGPLATRWAVRKTV